MNKLFIVGAGPGDPDLLTIKGKRIIDNADTVIYTGSLINSDIFNSVKETCQLINSSSLTLEEIVQLIIDNLKLNKKVVRVHTGDPTIYSAINEQINLLKKNNIDVEIIPGVSSFTGASSRLKKELTIPEVTQTIILTRLDGRTRVPELENLEKLASHQCTLIIFLSVHLSQIIQKELLKQYPPKTPIAIVYKATWKDEKIIRTTLENLDNQVKSNNINKTALIMIGKFLNNNSQESRLYNKFFSHEFR